MAVVYFDDSAGGLNNGTSWTNAYTSIATNHSSLNAGDIAWVASGHNETPVVNTTLAAISGDDANPICYISMNSATDAQLDGATFGPSTGVLDLTLAWSGVTKGMHWQATDQFTISPDVYMHFIGGSLSLLGTSSGDTFAFTGDDTHLFFDGVEFSFGHASQLVLNSARGGVRRYRNCALKSGTAAINDFLSQTVTLGGDVIIEGLDLSLGNTGCSVLFQFNATLGGGAAKHYSWYGIKLPTSGTVLGSATIGVFGARVEAYGVDTGGNTNGVYIADRAGTVDTDTAVYLDASGLFSFQFDASISAKARIEQLEFQVAEFAAAANSTITVHITEDNAAALNDDELWIEVDYPDATTATIRDVATTRTYTDTDNAAVTTEADPGWTGTGGFSNAKYYAPTLTISGGGSGLHRVRVGFGTGAARTIYVDPVVDVT